MQMIARLEGYALERGIRLMQLQTGIYRREAMGLHEKLGYFSVPPFGAYQEDPMNKFYEKRIL